ncbi:hypothetical protein D9758_002958 [Tetrapyrgos nigripes]|uniref:P-loop containing nucleoside triphosphate hydrolase protein n=1 Tax=Tetrapyrgos nigripes TaxID=182062 RepID=A0A8H5GQ97_9AGAR|nr:hypothetical protein D9758_002958 [Tetrapyrgos nigripes]
MSDLQVVLGWTEAVSHRNSFYLNTLTIPLYGALISAVILLLHIIVVYGREKRVTRVSDASEPTTLALDNEHSLRVSRFGGRVIFGFMAFRVVTSLALLALSATSLLVSENMEDVQRRGELLSGLTSLYLTILAIASLCTSLRWSSIVTRHFNAVSLASFLVYAYRDLVPLGTFTSNPLDAAQGWIIWAKVSLLALISVVIPLMIPRQHIPVDPQHPKEPSPEQTASLLSLLLYTFLDSVIVKAYRSPHLPYEGLFPLPDTDHIEYLKARYFRHIDPATGVKRRNLFWSLMRIFWSDYTVMTISLIANAVASFATPLGINQLLKYIEDPNGSTIIRPWVWIAWLFLGPELTSITWEWFVYIATRTVVRIEAILTQLVFEHALRIRLKAETSSETVSDSVPATPPSAESQQSSEDDRSTENVTLHSEGPSSISETLRPETSTKGSDKRSTSPTSTTSTFPAKPSTPAEKTSESSNMIGKINNLVTTDLQNIVDAKSWVLFAVHTPLQMALSVIFLHAILGWSAFVGLAVIVLCFPIPGFLAKLGQKYSKLKMKKTDGRIQTVSEASMNEDGGYNSDERVTNGQDVRMGKDDESEDYGEERRGASLCHVDESAWIVYLHRELYHSFPDHAGDLFYLTLIMKQPLNASKVFSSMVVFDKFTMHLQLLLRQMNRSIIAKVSLDRITEFLYDSELLDAYADKDKDSRTLSVLPAGATEKIGFHNATFSWSNDSARGLQTPSKRQFLLKIDELFFEKGRINLIVGPTGCGKSSILMALLSEMHFIPSGPDSWYNLPRHEGVAYAAQESWVQNATIKENIVFESKFDEERYKKVIYQCALQRDLSLFEAGDATEVGEKGLTLSGGQKARVTLARAVYSRAEILLLDDVLAALDVHTSKWIVDKCFKGDLLKDRTVILVSHNIVLTQPIASFVVSMKSGRVTSQGSVADALSHNKALAAEVMREEQLMEVAEEQIDLEEPTVKKSHDGKLIVAEEVELGHLGWPTVKLFLTSLGGKHTTLFFFAFIGFNIISEFSQLFQPWFLGYWADQYDLHRDDPSVVNVVYYIAIYACILAFSIFNMSMAYIVFLFGSIRSSRTLHKRLVESVLGTTLRWLDTTPTSRIIARCTRDIRDIDDTIPSDFSSVVSMTFMMIGSFLAVMIYTPAFLGVGLIIAILGILCGNIYVRAQMPIKRIQSNVKAPVLGHFGAAIAGLTSIRAYEAEESFKSKSMAHINYYSRPSRVFYNLNRWVDIRIDLLGSIFQAGLAAYLVYMTDQRSSATGFSLNMAAAFSGVVLYWVREANVLEVNANSLERINRYIGIEQEPKATPEGNPPAYWPASGDLRVDKLSASYSPGGPKVLRDLSFSIKSGERIGVVGRTGSGKSSLMLSLLRCIFTEGNVYYDGIPTASLNLEALRTNVTVIPQVPELLSGTVRDNLDPFNQYDDAMLNDSLRSAGLYSIQAEEGEDEDNRITLDTAIASSGNNLSVGQRQILALARAMVRGSKLLILDEATSAIDYKTDSAIQSSLRNELGRDVTLLIVAHRLQTIMDADKIMVLDAGKIVEFDSPSELLKIEQGRLRSLVDESADRERLYEMAQGQA